jgi:uncharacterized repeat protein (TIGR01451 family)
MNGFKMRGSLMISALGILSLLGTAARSATWRPATAPQAGSDVSVSLAADKDLIGPGEEITFTATMTNHGPEDATFVDVFFALPDKLEMVSMACDLGISPDTPACEYSSLPAGTTVVSTVVARLRTDAPLHGRMLRTTATVMFETAGLFDPNTHNNSAVVRTKIAGK